MVVFTVVLAFMILLNIASFIPATECSSEKFRVCGEKLVKMLNVVCKRCFNGGGFFSSGHETAKRTDQTGSELLYRIFSTDKNDQQQSFTEDWKDTIHSSNDDKDRPIHNADNVVLHRQTRIVSGIVQECCMKQCPYATLKSYCAYDCPWLKT